MSDILSAVVVAAGRSERFNRGLGDEASSPQSKLMVTWEGRPLLWHTVTALFHLPIHQMALVGRVEDFEVFEEVLRDLPQRSKIHFTEGGARRQDSVRRGILSLRDCDRVLVHDAARPFVSPEFLNRLNETSLLVEGLIPATPIVETLKEIDSSGHVVRTVDRNAFVRVQTPQFFKFHALKDAHLAVEESEKEFTDDAALMEYVGAKVRVASGHPENIKVTIPEDLRLRGIDV